MHYNSHWTLQQMVDGELKWTVESGLLCIPNQRHTNSHFGAAKFIHTAKGLSSNSNTDWQRFINTKTLPEGPNIDYCMDQKSEKIPLSCFFGGGAEPEFVSTRMSGNKFNKIPLWNPEVLI